MARGGVNLGRHREELVHVNPKRETKERFIFQGRIGLDALLRALTAYTTESQSALPLNGHVFSDEAAPAL